LSAALCALPAWARTRPHYGGALRIETAGDAWQGRDAIARRLVYEGLTTLDAGGGLKPALAVSWQSDDNSHRWQFRLRPGVRFHDGSALTATAVVQSLTLACATNCPWTAVRAVGSTVVFTSDSSFPNLPDVLASDVFLISLPRTPTTPASSQAIGTGPFEVTQMSGNVTIVTANESSWQGRPFVDQISITAHRAIRDQWLDLSLGRADVVEVPAEQMRQAQQQRLSVVMSRPSTALVLNLSDSGVLANPNLRAAVAYAVDRSSVFNVIFQKQGEVTASLVPKSVSGYAFLFPTDRDMNKATEARGGLTPGVVTLSTDGEGVMQLIEQRLALNLREAGFTVRFAPGMGTGYSDIALRSLPVAGSDAAGVLGRLLLAAGQAQAVTIMNPETAFQVEQDILSRRLIVPLIDVPRDYAIGGRVKNLSLNGFGMPDFASASVETAQ
jgi:ABC-type dipeptide transport system, periplasmic component